MSCPSLPLLIEEAISLQKTPVLFLNAELSPLTSTLQSLTTYQTFYDKAKQLEGARIKNVVTLPAEPFPLIIMLGQKSKDENLSLFSYALSHLETNGTFIVSMPNDLGASRFEGKLQEMAGVDITTRSRSKCRVFSVTLPSPHPEEQFSFNEITSPLGPFASVPGIFSEKEADTGSLLLADNLPPLSGNGADLGAGYGLLTRAVLQRSSDISNVDLYEIDYKALACAKKNLSQYSQCNFIWSDLSTGLKSKNYDWIISNPPFHQSNATNFNLGKKFIRTAVDSLNPSGRFFFVQNEHISYSDCFEGTSSRELARSNGFIVWELTKAT